jgi:hypothetical protein
VRCGARWLRWGLLLVLLVLAGRAAAEPRRVAFVFDPPAPIVMPLRIEAAGVQIGDVILSDDRDVASINATGWIDPAAACFTVAVMDASGQTAQYAARRGCGRTIWLAWMERS